MGRFFKKKSEFSKTIVILDIGIFILYVIINIIMQWKKGYSMPVDINTGVFAFLTSELGLLSFIKRSKLKTESIQNTIQDITLLKADNQIKQQIEDNKGAMG